MLAHIRSLLYVPARKPEMLRKIGRLGADFYIVDLEDGIGPEHKNSARQIVADVHAEGALPAEGWALRINAERSAWIDADLELTSAVNPPAVVLPKAEDPQEVARRAATLQNDALLLMLETAAGVGRARELAAHPSVRGLVYGSADLRRSLGARPDASRAWERHAMSEILLAARMHGCAAIDAVTFQFRDLDALADDAKIARDLGFDGKSCIHPAQLETVHRVFSSSEEELAWARRVHEAWEREEGERRGVIVVDGEMIEALHVDVARRILERAPR
ncbi:hypothetical protein ABI59_11340 [Acidobacteria bacterium Mor1]|nr:hypothetical protein ABI59_11340 [Acidobacteria bacterium Mor1]